MSASASEPGNNSDATLDAQIHAAELAVIERDERVQRGVRDVFEHLRLHAGAIVAVGTAAGAVGLLLFRFLRGSGRAAAFKERRSERTPALVTALGLLWAILPEHWRRGLPAFLFNAALPAIGKWLSHRRSRRQAAARGGNGLAR